MCGGSLLLLPPPSADRASPPPAPPQIESYVYDVVRSTVPKIDLDDVFTTKEEIAASIKENLEASMASFGYQILSTPITDIDPDREVKRAMNEINKMKRLRVAAEDEGEAAKIRAVKEAEAEASKIEIQAKADAEAKFLGGQGISRQRQAIMEGLRESVNAFKSEVKGVDAKTVMDLMIVTQYFDMMKDVGAQGKTNAVFLNNGVGEVAKGFMSGLPAAPGFAQAR
jgi:regulator of protease activity HflC (stomatin/prohibitin superfamily)